MKRGRSSLSVMVKQGGSVHRVSGSYRPEDRSWSGAHALTGCGTRSGNASRTRFANSEQRESRLTRRAISRRIFHRGSILVPRFLQNFPNFYFYQSPFPSLILQSSKRLRSSLHMPGSSLSNRAYVCDETRARADQHIYPRAQGFRNPAVWQAVRMATETHPLWRR